MKLISFNIAIFINNADQVADFIIDQKADIVAFQENVKHLEDSAYEEYQKKFHIDRKLKHLYPYSFFGPLLKCNVNSKDGKVYRKYGGWIEQGNEILSRYKIIEATNEHYHMQYGDTNDRTHFYETDHPRSVIVSELDVEGKRVQILNLHGTYTEKKLDNEGTIKQSEYILKAAQRKDIPTIIVGDFNLLPETKSIKMLDKKYRNLVVENNITSTRPDVRKGKELGSSVVDYIFVDERIKVNKFEVIKTEISDHYPLVLDFEIK